MGAAGRSKKHTKSDHRKKDTEKDDKKEAAGRGKSKHSARDDDHPSA